MSRKTTARRGAAAVLATAVLAPGFALGIAEAAPTDPVVTGLSTTVVPKTATPGTLVITGRNFGGADLVRITDGTANVDIVEQDFFVVSPTRLVVPLPDLSAVTSSAFDVLVRGADATTFSANTTRDNLKVTPAATLTSASVDKVPALGNGKVQLRGTNLLGAKKVMIGAYEARISKVTDTAIDITTPPLPVAGSAYGVVVTTPFGDVTLASAISSVVTVSRALPNAVDALGGTVVTVNGAGLKAVTAGDVKLVLKNAAGAVLSEAVVPTDDFEVLSEVEMVVRVPAADNAAWGVDDLVFAGSVVEVVVKANDTLAGYKPVKVQYSPTPVATLAVADRIQSLDATPLTREWHTLTLTGQNLAGGTVRVNGISVPTVSSSASSLTFKTVRQPNAVGPWTITVTTPKGGTRAVAGTLTYSPAVTVTPTTLTASSGEVVYVAGTGFKALSSASAVTAVVNGGSPVNVAYVPVSDTLLKLTLPAGGTAQQAVVTVTPPTGFGAVDTLTVTYKGTISITPTTASYVAAGETIDLAGIGFDALPGSGALTAVVDGASVAVTYSVTDNDTLAVTFPAATSGHTGTLTMTPPNGYGLADTVALTVTP